MATLRQRLRLAYRTLTVWFIVSALLFLLAGYLTIVISNVHGRPAFMRGEDKWIGDLPTQILSVYLHPESKELSQATGVQYRFGNVPYRTKFDSKRYAFVEIRLPPEADAKILVNNLKDPEACSSPRSATDITEEIMSEPPVHHLTILPTKFKHFGSLVYVLTPEKAKNAYEVRCFLNSVTESETFTTKRITFDFLASPELQAGRQLKNEWANDYGVTGFDPVRGLVIDLSGIPEAENVQFDNGFQEQGWAGFENLRVIAPGDFVNATWRDIRREQIRDMLLVIIGTLVAIGATTLIEGLRPLFELMAEKTDVANKAETVGSLPD